MQYLISVLRILSIPLILWLSMCASTSGRPEENREQVLLHHNNDGGNNRYGSYLVNPENYTTRGVEYHKKYQPYLIGISGEITEKHKMMIIPGTVGFYYDKKSDDRSRLYLGLDINSGITLHAVQGSNGSRIKAALIDLKNDGDDSDTAARATIMLRRLIPENIPVDVMDPSIMKEKLTVVGWSMDRIDSASTALDAGRSLGVEKVIYGRTSRKGGRIILKIYTMDIQDEEEDVLENEISTGDRMESSLRDFIRSFPSEHYNPLSEFDNRVPEYGEAALYLLNRHLRNIVDTLSLCGPVFAEPEIVGVVVGFKWIRQGRREHCNIWISTTDLVRFLDKRLAFPELVQRSTVTNTEGAVIRLPL